MKCKVVLEGANGPTTPCAEDVMKKRNIINLPDILSNSGGVIVSYYEYILNKNNKTGTERAILKRMKEHMNNTYDAVENFKEKNECTYKDACYVLAIKNIENSIPDRSFEKSFK